MGEKHLQLSQRRIHEVIRVPSQKPSSGQQDNHLTFCTHSLSDSICGAFITLGEALPNVVAPEEIGQLEEEIRAYQIDVDLVTCAQNYIEEEGRGDVDWWSRVVSMKNPERGVRFPILGQLVKALLSIFTGPLVEGSFNLMDDILEADRCSMNVETYESLAIVKSMIKARQWQHRQ